MDVEAPAAPRRSLEALNAETQTLRMA